MNQRGNIFLGLLIAVGIVTAVVSIAQVVIDEFGIGMPPVQRPTIYIDRTVRDTTQADTTGAVRDGTTVVPPQHPGR